MLATIVGLDQRWRDPSCRDHAVVAERLLQTPPFYACALLDAFGIVCGYVEYTVQGRDAHILWLCAPACGAPALRELAAHVRLTHVGVRTVSLSVSIERHDPTKRTAARLNLYMGPAGGFRVVDTTTWDDGGTSLYMSRVL